MTILDDALLDACSCFLLAREQHAKGSRLLRAFVPTCSFQNQRRATSTKRHVTLQISLAVFSVSDGLPMVKFLLSKTLLRAKGSHVDSDPNSISVLMRRSCQMKLGTDARCKLPSDGVAIPSPIHIPIPSPVPIPTPSPIRIPIPSQVPIPIPSSIPNPV